MSVNSRPSSRRSTNSSRTSTPACWQAAFLSLLPEIRRRLRWAFRDLHSEEREEAVQEGICNCCLAFSRLCQLGRPEAATARSLCQFAAAHYRVGRRVGARMNARDVTSAYCQYKKGVRVQSPDQLRQSGSAWEEMLVEDRSVTPADLAASRIDYSAWLKTLDRFRRRIAETLATGETTKRSARLFRISPARISQIRRELMDAWNRFHARNEPVARVF